MTNSRTPHYRTMFWVFAILSFLLNVFPIGFYTVSALLGGGVIYEKVALTMMVLVVLIMSIIAWANKVVLRSKVWIIIIGLYFVLDHFAAAIIILGVCQILDEVLVSRIKAHYKNKLTISREIDLRI